MRRAAVALAAATIAVGGGLLVNPSPANAHGATVFPGSRQYLCWVDGITDSGAVNPTNPACADAVAQSGTAPLYNWFGNLHSSNNGGTVGSIPDGRICDGGDGGPYDFSPYNAARSDWPRTHLTAGATYQFRYNNWAHHPGDFNVYVTQQGWNPSTPLQWSELELVHTETDPPSNGGPGTEDGYYYWDVTLPGNRSGDHIIFIHWVRSDSPEDFFACSDVAFDGGNGEVTGIGGTPTTPPTTTPPTTTPPTTTPPTTTPPTTTPPTSTPPVTGDCTVDYEVTNDWGSGFQGDVTVTNNGGAIDGWELTWAFPDGQQVDQMWNADPSQSGSNVIASNVSWNASIPSGGSVSFGFLGSASGGNGEPAAFSLNGTSCTVV